MYFCTMHATITQSHRIRTDPPQKKKSLLAYQGAYRFSLPSHSDTNFWIRAAAIVSLNLEYLNAHTQMIQRSESFFLSYKRRRNCKLETSH